MKNTGRAGKENICETGEGKREEWKMGERKKETKATKETGE
jgi:hypothetical protein